MRRIIITLLSVLFALLAATPSLADTVRLKDGRVIEGEITREGDAFIYITYKIGDLERSELILRTAIKSIDRDKKETGATPTPAPRPAGGPDVSPAAPRAPPGAASPNDYPSNRCKIAFITLEDQVGPFMNADALKKSIKLLSDDDPDIVVLRVNSGGGALTEVQKLSDVIEKEIKPKYRVVAWVESAISAAAMATFTLEEIYMKKEGNIGAATAFSMRGARAIAVKGEALEKVLRQMQRISQRGNHDPLIMRAMEVPSNLSIDIDENGKIHWRSDLDGQFIVSTENQILTFNSIDAVKYGLARGVADNKDDLASELGCKDWVEVGLDADAYQREFRDNVRQANVRAGELLRKMNIALNAGNFSRARAFLGQLRGWVRRAPSLEFYGAPTVGVPPLTREFFEQVQEKIDEIAKNQQQRSRR